MASKNVIIAVTLSILMITTAGCAGWGTDSPANPDEDTNGEGQPNESPSDGQETESDDSETEEQRDSEENSDTSTSTDSTEEDTSTSTDSTEESSSEVNSDETDTNGPSETDDGETVDETDETDTMDGTETDSSQRNSDQGENDEGDTSSSSNGDESQASGGNDEDDGEGPSENDESRNNGDTDDNENDENGGNGNGDDETGEQVTCEAFDTQEDSQEYFDENPEERGHLDENDDGIPCEHLPSDGEEPSYTLTVEADSPVTLERAWEDASTTREPTDGVVEFSVIAGEYTLSAERYEDEGVTVKNDRVVTMSPEEEQDVTITVTDEENTPIEGASVEVDGETEETDADGTVQFSLIDGEYGVSVSVEGYKDESTTIEIDSENDTFSVSLEELNGNGGGPVSLAVSNIHADAAGNDHENLNDEYIELTNEGSSAITMTGWTLSDEGNYVYEFPSGFTLEPDDSVTIYTGSGSDSDSQLYWNLDSSVWNNTEDTIIVTNANGETVIEREYPD